MVTRSSFAPFKAMILAAGRGERMRPLTDSLPKPLLQAGRQSLIEYHLDNLKCAGFVNIVINHAYLGKMIETTLGNGERYGINIRYSHEPIALETAGGIAHALPLLTNKSASQPFLVVNADVYCEMGFAELLPVLQQIQASPEEYLAHLVLVDNPVHHPDGDFALDSGQVVVAEEDCLTFSGIGVYHPRIFSEVAPNRASKLAPILRQTIQAKKLSGEHFSGIWVDVGTPERLHLLHKQLNVKQRWNQEGIV